MPRFDADDIRRYYDRHTPAFLAHGQGGGAGSIHRAVWGPGTTTRLEAFHYVDDLIAGLARGLLSRCPAPLHLVDLGCGVGASLCYLADRVPMRGTGVTLSPVQSRIAAARIRDAGVSDRVRCLEGDYTALPSGVAPADLAYAIESFVHGPSPERFFAECGRLVRPGGLLVICDDVRRSAANPAADRTIERFCRGWHINTLLGADALRALAHAAGFEHESTTDLSPWIEIRRARDRAIGLAGAVFDVVGRLLRPILGRDLRVSQRFGARYGYLLGGSALQRCLARGWVGYDFMVFRRA